MCVCVCVCVCIQGCYKRNSHFQCCIETKLLMIQLKYVHGFVVHVFKFIWRSYKCYMYEPFVTRQISIRQYNSVQTDLSIPSSTLATADVVLTLRKNACKQIVISPLLYYENCVSTSLTVFITFKVSIWFIVTMYICESTSHEFTHLTSYLNPGSFSIISKLSCPK
jgi:hypothetical protein